MAKVHLNISLDIDTYNKLDEIRGNQGYSATISSLILGQKQANKPIIKPDLKVTKNEVKQPENGFKMPKTSFQWNER